MNFTSVLVPLVPWGCAEVHIAHTVGLHHGIGTPELREPKSFIMASKPD